MLRTNKIQSADVQKHEMAARLSDKGFGEINGISPYRVGVVPAFNAAG